jgi:hypothetical protein
LVVLNGLIVDILVLDFSFLLTLLADSSLEVDDDTSSIIALLFDFTCIVDCLFLTGELLVLLLVDYLPIVDYIDTRLLLIFSSFYCTFLSSSLILSLTPLSTRPLKVFAFFTSESNCYKNAILCFL